MSHPRSVKQHLALHGASPDPGNHFSTTASVSYGHLAAPRRPEATPWMGQHQSRADRMPSGFQKSFFRDAPPGDGRFEDASLHKSTYAWPHTKEPPEGLHWQGDKNRTPLKACLHRYHDKEPRYYPFTIGAGHNAERLVSPVEMDPSQRFSKPNMYKALNSPPEAGRAFVAVTQKDSMPPSISGFATASTNEAQKLITAPQTDGHARQPALTLLGKERVEADSTKRYFHTRDFYDEPWLSSSRYYEEDNNEQAEARMQKSGTMDASKNARPNTGM